MSKRLRNWYILVQAKLLNRLILVVSQQTNLVLPSSDDTASTLLDKLERIEECLAQGSPLGAAIGHPKSSVPARHAAEVAKSQMPPQEHEYWVEFLRGEIKLPRIDWDTDRGDTPTSKSGLRKAVRRAEALNRLYGIKTALPSHSVWFITHHPDYLPLVKAMARVIGAERRFGQNGAVDMSDLEDLQAIRSVVSTALQTQQQSKATSKILSKGINRKGKLLISHQRRIQQERHARTKA